MKKYIFPCLFLAVFFFATPAFAGNLVISNVSLEARNASANTVIVEFDISWEHSWRKDDGRHDATWVFVKLLDGNTGTPSYPWLHGRLYTAGTNPNDGTSPGTNSNIEILVPSDKAGAFIRSKVTGNGTLASQNVRLVVDYGTAGASDSDIITAKVYGIEMVYIPEGPFYIGGDNPDLNEILGTVYNSPGFFSIFSSDGTFQWSRRIGGSVSGALQGIETDNHANIIASGSIAGNADLNGDGDTADTGETVTGIYASLDGFISVFNSSGTLQWSKRLGGTGSVDFVSEMAVDSQDRIVTIGIISDNADLNGDGDTADTNESAGGFYAGGDTFISVFNSSGTFQWSERLGGSGLDSGGISVAIDSDDRIIAVSSLVGNTDLTGDADTNDANESTGGIYNGTEGFISVFDSSGVFQWSERLGGTDSSLDAINAAAVMSNNNIVLVGNVGGNGDLSGDADTADANETGNTGVYGGRDIFISVFNSAGTFQWSKRLGGTASDGSAYVETNGADNIIVTGSTSGNTDLNGDGDTADAAETGGGIYNGNDAYISVFNSAGIFQWAKRIGGTDSDRGTALAIDVNGNIALLGNAAENADLNGDGDTADANETGGGVYASADQFISVFNSAGVFQWSERLGGTGSDSGNDIWVDENGNVLMGGSMSGNADLNGDAAVTGTYGFYQSGSEDVAVQITTTSKNISVDINSSDDIDTTAVAVDGDGGITGNASWPVGYNDFYLMKYEITQQQYRDFLNTLNRTQQGKRVAVDVSADTVTNYYVMSNGTTVSGRQGIRAPASGNGITNPITFGCDFNANGTFNEADDGCNIPMNWINWPDLAAYADWAGLRPMTELEYEKACRGPGTAVYGEKCWSGVSTTSLALTQVTSIVNSGSGTETSGNIGGGLVVYNNHASVQGPLRTGFAATSATNRISAGAGYYGNMGLSGNLQERTVSLGSSVGRAFTGTHGDGVVTTTASFEGNATNNDWPGIDGTTNKGVTAGTGMGWRGGGWNDAGTVLYVSDRNTATGTSTTRTTSGGGRVARTAP